MNTYQNKKFDWRMKVETPWLLSRRGFVWQLSHEMVVPGNGSVWIEVRTGDTIPVVTLRQLAIRSQSVIMRLVEDATIDAPGNQPLSAYNLDRNTSNSPQTKVYADSAGISGGTVITSDLIAASEGGTPAASRSGSISGCDKVRSLKSNSSTLLQIENLTSSQIDTAVLNLVWFE